MRNLWVYFNNSESDLNIDECGIQTYDESEIYQYKVYQNFVLHLVVDGEGFFLRLMDKSTLLTRGKAILSAIPTMYSIILKPIIHGLPIGLG